MKKLFSIIALCAATLASQTVSAGVSGMAHDGKKQALKAAAPLTQQAGYTLRSGATCNNVLNFAPTDTPYVSTWGAPFQGYVAGNSSLFDGTSYVPVLGIGEDLTDNLASHYVTTAVVEFVVATINSSDSGLLVTAYVYDTTGTDAYGNPNAPGNALDSASVTLGSIADSLANGSVTVFTFTHNAIIPSQSFFITVTLPSAAGDTIAAGISDLNSPVVGGDGWLNASGGNGWLISDSLYQSASDGTPDFIVATVCGTAAASCPTINVSTTVLSTTSADATASGGIAPYTYSWSNADNTDTATSLSTGSTYTVTATDHNGCTGTGSVTIAGIQQISAGVADFSVYPNPSSGVINASLHLVTASDVTMTIVDMTGNEVYESNDQSVKDQTKTINLGSIAPGIYIVNVKTASGSVNQRIAIK
jgi:hypothetical protein